MNDFSLGYVLDGKHFGTGIGIGKLPEAFAVREHVEDGGYVETLYVPERTCENVKGDDCLSFECSECHEGFSTDPTASACGWDTRGFRYCPSCGARVVEQ